MHIPTETWSEYLGTLHAFQRNRQKEFKEGPRDASAIHLLSLTQSPPLRETGVLGIAIRVPQA